MISQPSVRSATPSAPPVRLALRIKEAHEAIGISRSSLYEMIHDGKIKISVVAGVRVIPIQELERVVSEGLQKAA